MNYSDEDVARIAGYAASIARDFDRSGWSDPDAFLSYCASQAINRFWDQELPIRYESVTFTVNGVQAEGTPGSLIPFEQVALIANVPNADTCVFRRKRAEARDGVIRRGQSVRLQGGMSFTIANTGSA